MFCALQQQKQRRLGPQEDVREVWASLSAALEEVAQQALLEEWSPEREAEASDGEDRGRSREQQGGIQAGGTHAGQADSHEARLRAVCEVVAQYGRSLVADDLEGLQYLLMRLQQGARQRWRRFAVPLKGLIAELQGAVQAQYGGRVVLRVSRLL